MKRLLLVGAIVALCAAQNVALCAAQNQDSANRAVAPAAVPGALWRVPPRFTVQDWICGFGGCDETPASPFHFVKEDMEGTSPKVQVKDAKGRSWDVKFGAKVIPDCFSSRLVAALGYVTEPAYYVGSGRLDGAGACTARASW